MKERLLKFIVCVAIIPFVFVVSIGIIVVGFLLPLVALVNPESIKLNKTGE